MNTVLKEKELVVTAKELLSRQNMSLDYKVQLTLIRIRQWYELHNGMVYVAFSGGKDSTVLLHLVRFLYPEVPAVFSDTGLEFPEIKSFIRTFKNVIWVKPKLSFTEVIEKYGYPVPSKDVASKVRKFSRTKSPYLACRIWFGINCEPIDNDCCRICLSKKNYKPSVCSKDTIRLPTKWRFLLDAPFLISDVCCDKLKKYPGKQYQKETGRVPFIGIRANESSLRTNYYKKQGCNFMGREHISKPLSFWREEDIWAYIQQNKLPYSKIYDMGHKTTGCVFCGFGAYQKQKIYGENQFTLLKQSHPKLWRYCIKNLGMGDVLDYVGIKYN